MEYASLARRHTKAWLQSLQGRVSGCSVSFGIGGPLFVSRPLVLAASSLPLTMLYRALWVGTLRHNDLCNLTAHWRREMASNVQVEPELQPLTGEEFQLRSAVREDGLVWTCTWKRKAFGEVGLSGLLLIFGFLTLMPNQTKTPPWLLRTDGTSRKNVRQKSQKYSSGDSMLTVAECDIWS